MAYRPHDRNPSGILFFGTSTGDPVYDSSNDFTIGGGILHASAITVDSQIGTPADSDAITIGTNGDISLIADLGVGVDLTVAGNITGQGNMTLEGDLTVNGTTTTVNSTTITVEDPIIILGSGTPTSDDNKDRGVSFNYYDTTAKTGFFGFDDSTGRFTFVPDATINSETVSGSTGMIEANLMGDIYASNGTSKILENGTDGSDAVFTGNVVGNADTASEWETARNITLSGQVKTNQAVPLDGSSNIDIEVSLDGSAIKGQGTFTGIPQTDDFILIYDESASELKKINRAGFVSGLGAMSSFSIEDDDSTAQTIVDGDTLKFSSGSGISAEVSVTDTVTITAVDSEIDHDLLLNFLDDEHVDHSAVSIAAGAGLTGGGTILSSMDLDIGVTGGILLSTNDIKVRVDDSTIELSDSTASSSVRVKTSGITETQRFRSVETITADKDPVDHDVTLVNATFGDVTVTLPSITGSSFEGRVITIKRVDSTSNTVEIEANNTSDKIDGSDSYQLYYVHETLTFISDGSNWYII